MQKSHSQASITRSRMASIGFFRGIRIVLILIDKVLSTA
jgi:hypothetical protein